MKRTSTASPYPRAKKSLGQNFLVDDNIARKIAGEIDPQPGDTIMEIGPGLGQLTRALAPRADEYLAVEIDRRLIEGLEQEFGRLPKFRLVHGDFMSIDLEQLVQPGRRLRVVGNIPYHLTSPVIFKCFDHALNLCDLTLMIQREVAERVVAGPGSKTYGLMSVFSQYHAKPRILFKVSASVFAPRPKVESAVVQWRFRKAPALQLDQPQVFRALVRALFGNRRKMLRRTLKTLQISEQALASPLVDLTLRPEQLSLDDFGILTQHICRETPEDILKLLTERFFSDK